MELAAAGTGVGTIGDSSFATIDAGGLIASGNVNAFAASDLAAVPVNVTTTLDNSSFASAGTLSVTTSSNGSYVSVSPASAEIPQATSVTQDIPVDTIQTGVAEGDVGALTGGNLSGVEGIFEGTNQGVPGVASGILGGGAGGGVAGGVEGGGGGFGSGGNSAEVAASAALAEAVVSAAIPLRSTSPARASRSRPCPRRTCSSTWPIAAVSSTPPGRAPAMACWSTTPRSQS